MKAVFRPLLATAFVVALVASAACGGSSTASKSSGSGSSNTGSGSSGGGSSSSKLDPATNMPSSFPKDFPQYPGARLTSAFASHDPKTNSDNWIMGWQTLDSPQKVNDYMATNLNKGDWQVTGTFSGNGSFIFTAARRSNPKFSVTLTIGQNNEKTRTEIACLMGNGK